MQSLINYVLVHGQPPFGSVDFFTAILSAIDRLCEDNNVHAGLNNRQLNSVISSCNEMYASLCQKHVAAKPGSSLAEWRASDECGMSSRWMASRIDNAPAAFFEPLDPSDFGRCLGLVRAVRDSLDDPDAWFLEVRKSSPYWDLLLQSWDLLVFIYDRDFASGSSFELYDLMQSLRKSAVDVVGCWRFPVGC